jgi:hypothetical protein
MSPTHVTTRRSAKPSGHARADSRRQSERIRLRAKIVKSLRDQGFALDADGLLEALVVADKDEIRALHETARAAAIERARPGLFAKEDRLLERFAHGSEVIPDAIQPGSCRRPW